ncbi:MAG: DUF2785 domain-containing protein [Anaerolineae bacterium]
MHDETFWKAIADADYAVPEGEKPLALTNELLGYLGSPDEELRDTFGYTIIAVWTMRGVYTADDLRHIMTRLLPNLQLGIGERDNDGVLLRSFSALMLSVVAYGEHKTPFMTDAEYDTLLDAALEYLAAEKDLRGYVVGKGFHHSCAHTADIFKFMARSPRANAERLERMLLAIADKIRMPVDYVYVHSEDERMAMAILDIVKRDMLSREVLASFVERLLKVHELGTEGGAFDVMIHAPYMNVKNLLRALYFRLAFAEPPLAGAHDLQTQVYETLKKFGT